MDELKLVIYYTSSRQKIDNEIFTFETEQSRDDVLDTLDTAFGCYGIKTKRIRK